MTVSQPDWVPPGTDTGRANAARVYDYWLGGSHNFLADQDAGRAMAAIEPRIRDITRANRAFLARAVRFLAAAGISQFLDIGSGMPTAGNVHEIAQQACPGARVAYADIDPVAVAHATAILAGNPDAAATQGDLRDPAGLLASDAVTRLIDLTRPAGLLLCCVLHFLGDADDPWGAVAALRDSLVPGSYLVISHGTHENDPDVAEAAQKLYNTRVSAQVRGRSRAEILRFFDGFDLAGPGLVYIPQWRPGPGDVLPASPGRYACLVGVGRKR